MSRYFISLLIVLCSYTAYSQDKPIDLNPKDSITYQQSYGLRLGVDLSRILRTSLDDNYKGLELIADYRLTQNLYIAAEIGNEEKTKQEDLYNFTTSGSYIKVGVDKNNYANWYGEQNMIYIGGRLAFSTFENTLNNYQYFDTNRYWSSEDFPNGSMTPENFSGLSATWLEGVFGTKVEMFKNFYLGASIRLGIILSQKENDRFPNLYIPGFNKVTDGSRFGVGYNYSISYVLPFYKKKKKASTNTPTEEQSSGEL